MNLEGQGKEDAASASVAVHLYGVTAQSFLPCFV